MNSRLKRLSTARGFRRRFSKEGTHKFNLGLQVFDSLK